MRGLQKTYMFREEIKKHLEECILPFWMGLKDDEYGGYYGYVGSDLAVDRRASKGCILNSRILWFFSSCALILKDDKYLPYAKQAYTFMKDAFWDETNGGVYWSVTFDGKPEDKTKHTYCQAFAIYGLSAYFEAAGDREALKKAEELMHIIEDRCRDSEGYLEAFNCDFTPASNDKLSENGVMADRTMNTLLHVFEAYTLLYDADRDPFVAERMKEMLSIFRDRVYEKPGHRLKVFFDMDYNSLLDILSCGHDIETAWLIDRGIEVLGDETIKKSIDPMISDLADNILHTAFNGRFLPQEVVEGVLSDTTEWWVQAEALVGFLNEYSKDPSREEFLKAAYAEWDFIKDRLIMKESGGEWYLKVDREGSPDTSSPVVWPWKCPYHNGRMCLEVIKRIPDKDDRAS